MTVYLRKFWSSQRYLFGSFFLVIITISLFMYRGFGISFDEGIQAQHLKVNAKKIFTVLNITNLAPDAIKKAENLDNYSYKYYGVSAQYPLLVLEFFPHTFDPTQSLYWEVRHLYTRALFILAGVAIFLIIRKMTGSNFVVMLGLLLFFLHPRISAHSFYNIKDSVFLSLFTYSMYFLYRFIQKPGYRKAILLGIISALAVNVRMAGLLIPAYFFIWSVLYYRKDFRSLIKTSLLFTTVFSVVLYIIWPALWGNPVQSFLAAFDNFSSYTGYQGVVLFNGKIVDAYGLPFYYIPVWIFITSPFAHLLVWCFSLILFPVICLINPKRSYLNSPAMFSMFFIVCSFVYLVTCKTTLYDGWRHFHYLFAPLVVLGVYGIDYLRNKVKLKMLYRLFIVCILSSLTYKIYWMTDNYPYHYIFFNYLARSDYAVRWERDYWDLSVKQLLIKLVEADTVKKPDKYLVSGAGWSVAMLPENIQNRIVDVPRESAEFIIIDYRSTIGDYSPARLGTLGDFKEFTSITVDGEKLSSIYRRTSATK